MAVELLPMINELKSAFDLFRSAIGLAKDAKDLLPTGTATREAITSSLNQAERAGQLAEAQIAQALGYRLCQCVFPPQIMLSIGYHSTGVEQFECSRCRMRHPSDQLFRSIAEEERRAREYNPLDN